MIRITPYRILGAAAVLFLLYAYPGYMHGDAANQLVDSRTGDFTDWQPPIMTEVWRVLGMVIAGPPAMLILQAGLLLVGSYQLARRVMTERAAALAAGAVLVLPPVLVTNAVITPEVLCAGLLVSGTAALLAERLWVRLVGLGLVALACGLHDTAPVAAFPIVLVYFVVRPETARIRRIAIAAGAWLAAVLVAWGLSWVLVDIQTDRDAVELAAHDVPGMLRYAHLGATEKATLLAGVPDGFPQTTAEAEALVAARSTLIRKAPAAYLRHRARFFVRVLGFTKSWSPVYTQFISNREHAIGLQHLARHSSVQAALIASVRAVSFLLEPFLYLAALVALLPLAIMRRHRLAIVLLVSALASELSLFFTASRVELNDSHWMIVAVILAAAMLLKRGTNPQ